jgi:hypothetical protein
LIKRCVYGKKEGRGGNISTKGFGTDSTTYLIGMKLGFGRCTTDSRWQSHRGELGRARLWIRCEKGLFNICNVIRPLYHQHLRYIRPIVPILKIRRHR